MTLVFIHSTGLPLIQWRVISGNCMDVRYLLNETSSPYPSQNDGVEGYMFRLLTYPQLSGKKTDIDGGLLRTNWDGTGEFVHFVP